MFFKSWKLPIYSYPNIVIRKMSIYYIIKHLEEQQSCNKASHKASLTWQDSNVYVCFSVLILSRNSHLERVQADSQLQNSHTDYNITCGLCRHHWLVIMYWIIWTVHKVMSETMKNHTLNKRIHSLNAITGSQYSFITINIPSATVYKPLVPKVLN